MKLFLRFLLAFLITIPLLWASQMHFSTLEEVPTSAISIIVDGEIKAVGKPVYSMFGPNGQIVTTDYQVSVHKVLLGKVSKKAIVVSLVYQGIPGVSLKTLYSGIESEMKVDNRYLLLMIQGKSTGHFYLIRTEVLEQKAQVEKKFSP